MIKSTIDVTTRTHTLANLRELMWCPSMGGPGGAGTEGVGAEGSPRWGPGRRNLAFERQMAANPSVGAGMAAD